MKPEQQRIKLAEWELDAIIEKDGMVLFQHPEGTGGYRRMDLSGWYIYKRKDGSLYGTNWLTPEDARQRNIEGIAKRNNYLSDLNAVHALEERLSHDQYITFIDELIKVLQREQCYHGPSYFAIHATAAQRCEALLKTLGLWEETK